MLESPISLDARHASCWLFESLVVRSSCRIMSLANIMLGSVEEDECISNFFVWIRKQKRHKKSQNEKFTLFCESKQILTQTNRRRKKTHFPDDTSARKLPVDLLPHCKQSEARRLLAQNKLADQQKQWEDRRRLDWLNLIDLRPDAKHHSWVQRRSNLCRKNNLESK